MYLGTAFFFLAKTFSKQLIVNDLQHSRLLKAKAKVQFESNSQHGNALMLST
jgi:hypothetical protein